MHDPGDPAVLREKAAKCRRLAAGMVDDQSVGALRRLAEAYEQEAAELENRLKGGEPQQNPMPPAQ